MNSSMPRQMKQMIIQDGPAVRAFAFGLTRNTDDAEDLAQETYRKVARQWLRYDRRRALRSWCFTVLKNLYLDGRRRYAARNVVSLDRPTFDGGPSLDARIPDSRDNAQESLERRETIKTVQWTLKRMSVANRVALTLCYMDGMTYEKAARIIGVPLGTLRSRLHRARLAFRRQYPDPAYV